MGTKKQREKDMATENSNPALQIRKPKMAKYILKL